MEYRTYEDIWKNIILPIYDNICGGNSNFSLNTNNKDKILKKYIKIRDQVKKKYMDDSDHNIDRHKIAAIMMAAIEEVYPIKISIRYILQLKRDGKEIDKRFMYANETLAFFTALSILENFKDYGIDGNIEMQRKSIVLPNTYNESDYAFNTYIDLFYSKRNKRINVLTFSNVFFLLERLAEVSSTSPENEDAGVRYC